MQHALRQELTDALASKPTTFESVSGGCISEAYACHLADGRKVFVKTKEGCDPRMFRAEARGLGWLAEAKCLPTPEVLAVGDAYLALSFVEAAAPARDFDETFGAGLARLHQFGASQWGLEEDGFLATLTQDNQVTSEWSEFYVERRLRPLLRRAVDHSLVPTGWDKPFELLFAKMHELAGEDEKVARLHGDLWSGNVHSDHQGRPVLIDPAAYGGHREVDLAMLRLFGNPSAAFYRAYEEIWPLAAGHQERIPLYQLYPLLAHVNLFGGSYIGSCERALQQYL
jgi:fructosamine-3-kinase